MRRFVGARGVGIQPLRLVVALAILAHLMASGTSSAQTSIGDCASFRTFGQGWLAPADSAAHPLVGRVLDARTGEDLARPEFSELFQRLVSASTPLVLLGEVHDNPEHHLLRAGLVAIFGCAGPKSQAAVFEHIRADQQDGVEGWGRGGDQARSSADLFRALEWDKSGWPAASLFAPLFDAAIAAGLSIVPGDPSRARVRALARGEASGLPAEERTRLKLDEPMPQPLLDALAAELKGSHCGMLPDRAIAGLSAAQRYRDAYQADALLGAGERHGGAILLAGNGHVRADRGVPWHIRQRAPDKGLLTVMFVEAQAGNGDPMSYVPRDPDGRTAVDYVVFTPRAVRSDPCEDMRRHIEKKG